MRDESLLPKFAAKNALSFDINCIQMGEQDLEVSLNINNASYHHSCKNAYNNRMYERLIGKEKRNTNAENEDILKSPPTKRRSTVSPNIETPSQAVCCFCKCIDIRENLVAAGTLHATKTKTQINHVKNMTANWIEMAKVLEDENLLIQLSHRDVASNEMFYHKSNIKCCYQKYRKQYFKKLKEKNIDEEKNSLEKWYKIHSLNKVIHNLKQTENENPGYVFEVKQLENKCVEILNSYGYNIDSRVSRFGDMLKQKLPVVELRNIGKKLTLSV